MPGWLAVALWLLTLIGLGVAVLPLTMQVFGGLPDRGYGLTRTLGIVVVGWLAYLAAMLGFVAYVGPTVLILAIGVGIGCWLAWGRECLAELRARRGLVIAQEMVFVAIFGLATFVRAYNADIVGQEKFMDYAFVNALLRTTTLPAEDMWLSGTTMPYYYLGYLLAGLPAKIAQTPGPIAYNLAVVWVFASGFTSAATVVYGLVARRPAATLAPAASEAAVPDTEPAASASDVIPPIVEAIQTDVADETSMDVAEPVPVEVCVAVAASTIDSVQVATIVVATEAEDLGTPTADSEPAPAAEDTGDAPFVPATDDRLLNAPVADDAASPPEDVPASAPEPLAAIAQIPIQWAAFAFAVLGGILTVVVGNLVGPLELMAAQGWGSPEVWQVVAVKGLQAMPSGGLLPLDGGWWWRSSRVIANIQPDGITEFPYFSFLLGDLHPHYLAIPFTLLVVALTANRWLGAGAPLTLPVIVVTGLVLATLLPASTWDVPAFWGLYAIGAIADGWRRHRSREKLLAALPAILAPFVVAAVVVVPYFIGYQSQPLGLGIVRERTPLVSMLIIFGPAMLAAGLFALWLGTRRAGGIPAAANTLGRALVLLGLFVLGMTVLGQTTIAILVALLIGLGAAGWSRLQPSVPVRQAVPAPLFCWLLGVWALTILVGVEVIYLRDVFGTRMNTVFKFQYQAWLLLGIASAAGLGLVWTRSPNSGFWRPVSTAAVIVILVPGLVYPLAATWTKSNAFRGEPTLMGDRFLERGTPADYRAIEWLRTSTEGRPVVVEAVGGDYSEHARVSTFSGLPTLMGWVGHELQWRGDRPELRLRPEAVDAIYRAESVSELTRLSQNYGIRYVFFGNLERDKYGADAQSRLDRLLPVAFSRGGTTIYAAPFDTAPAPVP